MLNETKYRLEVTFTAPVLGSQPQRDVATEYLAGKHPDKAIPEEELATLEEHLERGTTAFHKVDGCPVFWNYQVKGFLKEVGLTFNARPEVGGVKNLRSKINNEVFVFPRLIHLEIPQGSGVTFLERPLRAMTAQGPRTAVVRSEQLPEGTKFSCEIAVLKDTVTEGLLRSLLDYGKYQGFGQWRNGSWGTFTYELIKI